jgi:hypothetical protein
LRLGAAETPPEVALKRVKRTEHRLLFKERVLVHKLVKCSEGINRPGWGIDKHVWQLTACCRVACSDHEAEQCGDDERAADIF